MFKVVKDKDDTLNKSQDKELTTLFINKFNVSDFRTRFFFSACHTLRTWFEL